VHSRNAVTGSVAPPSPDFATFSRVPVLATIDHARRQRLWELSALETYRRGEIVRMQGDRATHVLVLLSGALASSFGLPDGRTVALDNVQAPCAVDKTAIFDTGRHSATLTALEACVVACVPREAFLETVTSVSSAAGHVFGMLARQHRLRQSQLVASHISGAKRRVAWWLTDHVAMRRSARVPLPGSKSCGSQEGLAQVLGLTRVTVNRALKSLEREGTIRLRRGEVEVLRLERLTDMVGA